MRGPKDQTGEDDISIGSSILIITSFAGLNNGIKITFKAVQKTPMHFAGAVRMLFVSAHNTLWFRLMREIKTETG